MCDASLLTNTQTLSTRVEAWLVGDLKTWCFGHLVLLNPNWANFELNSKSLQKKFPFFKSVTFPFLLAAITFNTNPHGAGMQRRA